MRLTRVTAPAAIIPVAEAKKHVGEESTDFDWLIERMVAAATEMVDGWDGLLGRALGVQTWDLYLDGHEVPGGCCHLKLPLPPLISVDEVEYRNGDGDLTTWPTADYDVYGVGDRGRIAPAEDETWPIVQLRAEAFRVRFTCGYRAADNDSPAVYVDATPDAIRSAILIIFADLYRHRGDGEAQRPMPEAAMRLLHSYRAWTI